MPTISSVEALNIAIADAKSVYPDVDRFRIVIVLEKTGWHIDFYIKEKLMAGGGPHYIIDADEGSILYKKYCQ